MRYRRLVQLTVAGLLVALAVAGAIYRMTTPRLPGSWPAPSWQVDAVGHIYMSSPTVARVGSEEVVAVGTESGYLELLDAATGEELPGWPQRVASAPGQPAAIESSPTIAFLDGPRRPPTVVVGTGSTSVADGYTVGEVEAFYLDGAVRFVFHVGNAGHGTAIGVISSPAVGDVTGDGQLDVVFGSWDHDLYALTPSGTLVPGFPVDNEDTIWSSPALRHVRGAGGREDIFVGSDASGGYGCEGGFVTDYTYRHGGPSIVWRHCEPQTIWSSPAIGVIDTSGRLAVVVGTGFGHPRYLPGSADVYAFYADDGAPVPGWPVATSGPTPGSPAIGAGPGGTPIVVVTSWYCDGETETSCFVENDSEVLELSGSGEVVGRTTIAGATALSSPVLVPLRGEESDDIIVGAASGLYAIATVAVPSGGGHEAASLGYLFGIKEVATIGNQCAVSNSAALADPSGHGAGAGWHVIEACGGPAALHHPGEVISYPLPVPPSGYEAIWPQFHDTPEHDGDAGAAAAGMPVPTSEGGGR